MKLNLYESDTAYNHLMSLHCEYFSAFITKQTTEPYIITVIIDLSSAECYALTSHLWTRQSLRQRVTENEHV